MTAPLITAFSKPTGPSYPSELHGASESDDSGETRATTESLDSICVQFELPWL